VRKKSKVLARRLGACRGDLNFALAAKFGNGLSNTIIETAIQCTELSCRHLRAILDRELGYRLAEVAIIVNHLIYSKPVTQQFETVPRRGRGDLR